MNNNQNIQQPKPDPKGKAVASFVLGIIAATPNLLILTNIPMVLYLDNPPITFASLIIGVAAIVFGIMGISSSKRKYSIIGVSLGLIPFLSLLRIYVLFYFFGLGRY